MEDRSDINSELLTLRIIWCFRGKKKTKNKNRALDKCYLIWDYFCCCYKK